MKIYEIENFIEVCRYNSFSKAAQALFISRQSLLRSINNLEDELEYPLFSRGPMGITLTEFGREFYKKAVEAVRDAGILHFGSVSLTDPACRDTIVQVVKAAKEDGSLITYDPNYRAALWTDEETATPVIRSVLPLCDIVKISDEETKLVTGAEDPHEAAKALTELGVKLVIVTLGAHGALWRFGELEGTVPGFAVKVADTNGAGDTFFGAFLSRIVLNGGLEGLTAEKLSRFVRFANKAASLTTSRSGAIPAMPTLQELEGFDA